MSSDRRRERKEARRGMSDEIFAERLQEGREKEEGRKATNPRLSSVL